jgi:hypothetical protein
MNILQQYKQAVAARGGNTTIEIKTGPLAIGDTFKFGGYEWQRVGEIVRISHDNGYARIISIDAGGFKTARRVK